MRDHDAKVAHTGRNEEDGKVSRTHSGGGGQNDITWLVSTRNIEEAIFWYGSLTDHHGHEVEDDEIASDFPPLAQSGGDQEDNRSREIHRNSQELGVDIAVAHTANDRGPVD